MATLSEPVEKPGHIPDEAVFDFDYHYDPALLADPHKRMRELLDTAPKVFWTPRNGGTWIAIGFNEVFDALRWLRPIREIAHRFGGSHAQRDLIDLTLIEAARRAGRDALADALSVGRRASRTARSPEGPIPRRPDTVHSALAA